MIEVRNTLEFNGLQIFDRQLFIRVQCKNLVKVGNLITPFERIASEKGHLTDVCPAQAKLSYVETTISKIAETLTLR